MQWAGGNPVLEAGRDKAGSSNMKSCREAALCLYGTAAFAEIAI